MRSKLEGILLRKTLIRDKDIIATILLRNGKKVDAIFYGGKGGGKRHVNSILEYGHMLAIELQPAKDRTNELYLVKEWSTIWSHQAVRKDYQAFFLLTFFLELIEKLATQDDLQDSLLREENSAEGLFRVLSNAVYYLEEAVANKIFQKNCHQFLFLFKLISEMGIMLEYRSCHYCHRRFDEIKQVHIDYSSGVIICDECTNEGPFFLANYCHLLSQAAQLNYKDYVKLPVLENLENSAFCQRLLEHILHHAGGSIKLKSWRFVS